MGGDREKQEGKVVTQVVRGPGALDPPFLPGAEREGPLTWGDFLSKDSPPYRRVTSTLFAELLLYLLFLQVILMPAVAGGLSWLEHCPMHQKDAGSIPGQGAYLG